MLSDEGTRRKSSGHEDPRFGCPYPRLGCYRHWRDDRSARAWGTGSTRAVGGDPYRDAVPDGRWTFSIAADERSRP